ncbi:GNAT family N-acetyltransferase [Pseudomonas sp. GD04058]|uniref:GNAT family N-acetyltransferase n=1 Tax=Pseudomonas sp. GD04058 TaxID=2975429 RepID=UPI00244BE69D|nr:GNAT family N-acetyltransferase [Pseudomonas sp. GD04058]MDG9882418.1 GNAT family N-acetyltransferase [Pseudomonas sp. GD04058]
MTIRPARPDDAVVLPAIERSAAQSFAAIAHLAWLASHEVLGVEQHLAFIANGLHWVAVDDEDRPEGFLCASAQGHALHIEELSVARSSQGRGLGRELITHVQDKAAAAGFQALTLTTFADVPWNAPFYARLGFERVGAHQTSDFLRQQLQHEHALGLPGRCAMVKRL